MRASDARLERSAPYFPVPDLNQAVRHYHSVLGFNAECLGGDPAEFAIMSRDGLAIMLWRVDRQQVLTNEARGGTWDVFFWVTGLDSLVHEFSQSGAEFAYQPLIQEDYGMKEFDSGDFVKVACGAA